MAEYPSAVYSPRTKENKDGVEYDAGATTKLFAEDVVGLDNEVVAIENELGANPKGAKASVKARLDDVDTAISGKQDALGFTPENVANKDTDGALTANSDTKYPSQKAVKTYADTKADLSTAQTFTNKRITPRIQSEASSATPTPNGDSYDQYCLTALAAGATFAAPSGTPTNGQKLIIRIKDDGTARSLAWNAIYRESSDLALPTTTVISKTMYLGFIYNSADSKWDLVALLDNF